MSTIITKKSTIYVYGKYDYFEKLFPMILHLNVEKKINV